ncbi:methylthioadenosine nucleosidase /adenosylhomocysteine nucleosidase [Cupriavidus sp. OV038]|jgi:adenosylhomocysteine nucleosidase|uniref:5'-methylthioadenosine/adenosylhomocysteine nucleosidase n=1 Tax=unclassified Cupriavidus TaxID=2640874 RepID=UPI0008E79DF6|nr:MULTISPECIES: 5'-methylthioadenosine/adenosylhomocysteine nucleosidase [unclassified Cupriavidus]SFD19913.1 methylthioadenosine nucleosidase /adenosylhomocysteine nucleosidase [Cupriavidus sp. OV038]SFP86695.1 methylthioadenosine nucleosidase /adenosylhomocysteine nucleosidase [Cupriavidus sp. OV096]
MTLGILAALHDEVDGLIAAMRHEDARATVRTIGMRDYYAGTLHGQSVVLVLARVGKVAAAATTVTLIREFGVDEIVFTGLAGGVGPEVRVGDIVVADRTLQHDLDARPLFPRHEVPLLARADFPADAALTAALRTAADDFLRLDLATEVPDGVLARFGVAAPRLHVGMVASGDQFINAPAAVADLRERLPGVQAVEMEGAALAQICYEYGVPYAVMRTVSDRADDVAHVDFSAFLRDVASHYSSAILRRFLSARGQA